MHLWLYFLDRFLEVGLLDLIHTFTALLVFNFISPLKATEDTCNPLYTFLVALSACPLGIALSSGSVASWFRCFIIQLISSWDRRQVSLSFSQQLPHVIITSPYCLTPKLFPQQLQASLINGFIDSPKSSTFSFGSGEIHNVDLETVVPRMTWSMLCKNPALEAQICTKLRFPLSFLITELAST